MLNAAKVEQKEIVQLRAELLGQKLFFQNEKIALEKIYADKFSMFTKELEEKDLQIDLLAKQLILSKKMLYGRSSEKFTSGSGQLGFFNEAETELETSAQQLTSSPEATNSKAKKKRGTPKRRPIPECFPRRDVVIELDAADRVCSLDGMELSEIGREVSEKLNIIPATVEVVRTIRVKYGCGRCKEGVRVAPLPAHIMPKSLADVGLLATILVSKFVDHLPLYRIEDILDRVELTVPRCTMASWIVELGKKFMVLRNLMKDRILSSEYICADETPVLVLDNRAKKKKKGKPVNIGDPPLPKPQNGYMWIYARPGADPIVLYDYHSGRSGGAAAEMLEGFTGYLQVDGYVGYDSLCGEGKATRIGCWAHSRRKFHEAWITLKEPKNGLAYEALCKIARLSAVEDQIREMTVSERHLVRLEKSQGILDEIHDWLVPALTTCLPESATGKALAYLHNHWSPLIAFLKDGRLEITNNFIENKIRPFAVGRKNWLFSATTAGAESSAVIYSLIETAKANGLDTYDYIHWLLENFPKASTVDDFEKLLPHNAKKLLIPSHA